MLSPSSGMSTFLEIGIHSPVGDLSARSIEIAWQNTPTFFQTCNLNQPNFAFGNSQ